MSDDYDEDYQSNDCVDCYAAIVPPSDQNEYLEIGPICFGCLADRLETAEARIKELEDFAKEVITAEDDSPWAEDSAVNLQFLAGQAKAILGDNK